MTINNTVPQSALTSRIHANFFENKTEILSKTLIATISIVALSILASNPISAIAGIGIGALFIMSAYCSISSILKLNKKLTVASPSSIGFTQKIINHLKAHSYDMLSAAATVSIYDICKTLKRALEIQKVDCPFPFDARYPKALWPVEWDYLALKMKAFLIGAALIGIAVKALSPKSTQSKAHDHQSDEKKSPIDWRQKVINHVQTHAYLYSSIVSIAIHHLTNNPTNDAANLCREKHDILKSLEWYENAFQKMTFNLVRIPLITRLFPISG